MSQVDPDAMPETVVLPDGRIANVYRIAVTAPDPDRWVLAVIEHFRNKDPKPDPTL